MIANPDDLAALEAEALADGFDGMTPPTLEELRDALPLAQQTRAKLRGAANLEHREPLPEIRERLGAVYLASEAPDPPPPLLIDRLDPEAHTILYGQGGVGKGVLATHWIVQLVRLGHKVLILDFENHRGEWVRRRHGLAGNEHPSSVLHVPPLAATWGGTRGAIWQQEQDIRALAEAFDATYLVVDSVVAACAGFDPVDPSTASRYASALEYLGRPVLSLAHVPKDGNLAYPFGSVFFHNLARMTWSLSRDGTGVVLTNRKSNNYTNLGRYLVDVTWSDNLPREVWEQGYSAALADQIAEALSDGAFSVAEIVDRLADELDDDASPVKADSVSKALRRGTRGDSPRFTVTGTGGSAKYSRAEP